MSNLEVLSKIQSGDRLQQPQDCPDAVYNSVMLPLWEPSPELRLSCEQAAQVMTLLAGHESSPEVRQATINYLRASDLTANGDAPTSATVSPALVQAGPEQVDNTGYLDLDSSLLPTAASPPQRRPSAGINPNTYVPFDPNQAAANPLYSQPSDNFQEPQYTSITGIPPPVKEGKAASPADSRYVALSASSSSQPPALYAQAADVVGTLPTNVQLQVDDKARPSGSRVVQEQEHRFGF
jgi:hypothetical protein